MKHRYPPKKEEGDRGKPGNVCSGVQSSSEGTGLKSNPKTET